MTSVPDVQINLDLDFPKAGISFSILVEPTKDGSDNDTPSFSLVVSHYEGGWDLPLTVDVSPQLADWVRGYSRWLVRAKVRATHDESGITGTFAPDLQPEQVLQGLLDACEMIMQRFELYEESILV